MIVQEDQVYNTSRVLNSYYSAKMAQASIRLCETLFCATFLLEMTINPASVPNSNLCRLQYHQLTQF